MIVKLENAKIKGEIKAIPSKSYAHRIAICNFLAGNVPSGGCVGFTSKDITATEDCLKSVLDKNYTVDCGESGSTLRFLLPLFSALGGEFTLIGHGKLMQRPNDELFAVLKDHGIAVEKTDVIKISGKLSAGDFRVRGDISSQYISGLLMALPILDGDSKIILSTPMVSASYVDITLEVLSAYGIKIEKTDYGFFVKGNQEYIGKVASEGDWSNSAFFLVLGAVAGEITVTGLNNASVQGDRTIIDILRLAGATVKQEKDTVTVTKNNLKGFSFDAENCPDLVPIAAALAANAEGETTIKSVERLKIKESDRIESTIAFLSSFGIKAQFNGRDLIINGGKTKGGIVDGYNDHRIVMSAAVMAAVAIGESQIIGAEAVEKSYPTFFADYKVVGGKAVNGN